MKSLVTAPAVWSAKGVRAESEHAYVVAAQCYKEVPAPDHVAKLLLENIIEPAVSSLETADLEVVTELLVWLEPHPVMRPDWASAVELFRQHLTGETDWATVVGLLTQLLQQPHPLRSCVRDIQRQLWSERWHDGSYEEAVDALIALTPTRGCGLARAGSARLRTQRVREMRAGGGAWLPPRRKSGADTGRARPAGLRALLRVPRLEFCARRRAVHSLGTKRISPSPQRSPLWPRFFDRYALSGGPRGGRAR